MPPVEEISISFTRGEWEEILAAVTDEPTDADMCEYIAAAIRLALVPSLESRYSKSDLFGEVLNSPHAAKNPCVQPTETKAGG